MWYFSTRNKSWHANIFFLLYNSSRHAQQIPPETRGLVLPAWLVANLHSWLNTTPPSEAICARDSAKSDSNQGAYDHVGRRAGPSSFLLPATVSFASLPGTIITDQHAFTESRGSYGNPRQGAQLQRLSLLMRQHLTRIWTISIEDGRRKEGEEMGCRNREGSTEELGLRWASGAEGSMPCMRHMARGL